MTSDGAQRRHIACTARCLLCHRPFCKPIILFCICRACQAFSAGAFQSKTVSLANPAIGKQKGAALAAAPFCLY